MNLLFLNYKDNLIHENGNHIFIYQILYDMILRKIVPVGGLNREKKVAG